MMNNVAAAGCLNKQLFANKFPPINVKVDDVNVASLPPPPASRLPGGDPVLPSLFTLLHTSN